MTERQQFNAALDVLYNMSLPNAPSHKPAAKILADLFEILNASNRDELGLDSEHRRWLYEWAREQWESMPALGDAPQLLAQ